MDFSRSGRRSGYDTYKRDGNSERRNQWRYDERRQDRQEHFRGTVSTRDEARAMRKENEELRININNLLDRIEELENQVNRSSTRHQKRETKHSERGYDVRGYRRRDERQGRWNDSSERNGERETRSSTRSREEQRGQQERYDDHDRRFNNYEEKEEGDYFQAGQTCAWQNEDETTRRNDNHQYQMYSEDEDFESSLDHRKRNSERQYDDQYYGRRHERQNRQDKQERRRGYESRSRRRYDMDFTERRNDYDEERQDVYHEDEYRQCRQESHTRSSDRMYDDRDYWLQDERRDAEMGGRPKENETRRSFDRHRNFYNGEEPDEREMARRLGPYIPQNWSPRFRNVEDVVLEGVEGSRNLNQEDDRRLQVLNLGNPRRIENWEQCEFQTELNANIRKFGFFEPREFQKVLIPLIIDGHDIIAQCETGGGKTAAFAIPIIQQLLMDPQLIEDAEIGAVPLAIVVAPTRELARQIFQTMAALTDRTRIKVRCSYGHMKRRDAISQMNQRGCQILVGTCGRIHDHIVNHDVDLSVLKFLVFDDADIMHEYDDTRPNDFNYLIRSREMRRVLPTTQVIATSATFGSKMERIFKSFMKPAQGQKDIVRVRTIDGKINSRVELVFHRSTSLMEKEEQLVKILKEPNADGTRAKQLVLVNKRETCQRLVEFLHEKNIDSVMLTSNQAQNVREANLENFRQDKCDVLIVTDMFSRGINIHWLDRAIVFDVPPGSNEVCANHFVNRIGRVGRLREGTAHTLINVSEENSWNGVGTIVDVVVNKNGRFIPSWLEEFARQARPGLYIRNVRTSVAGENSERNESAPQVVESAPNESEESQTFEKKETDPVEFPAPAEEPSTCEMSTSGEYTSAIRQAHIDEWTSFGRRIHVPKRIRVKDIMAYERQKRMASSTLSAPAEKLGHSSGPSADEDLKEKESSAEPRADQKPENHICQSSDENPEVKTSGSAESAQSFEATADEDLGETKQVEISQEPQEGQDKACKSLGETSEMLGSCSSLDSDLVLIDSQVMESD